MEGEKANFSYLSYLLILVPSPTEIKSMLFVSPVGGALKFTILETHFRLLPIFQTKYSV